MIDSAEWMMEPEVKAFWNLIKIFPQKWQLPPIGDLGGGFWVVAVIGQQCIYYNDIEDGFNLSGYETFGLISEYYTNQSDLLSFLHSYWQDFLKETAPAV